MARARQTAKVSTSQHPQRGRSYDRIQIVPIRELLYEDKRLDIPMSLEVLKRAQLAEKKEQLGMFEE